jgi:hypothetical protein
MQFVCVIDDELVSGYVITLIRAKTRRTLTYLWSAMDAVGAAASIIGIIELTAKLASVCLEYSRAVRNASKDIERLYIELKNLQNVVEKVKQLLDRPESAKLSAARESFTSLDECLLQLRSLQQKLEPENDVNY